AKGQDARTDATFQLLGALVQSPLGLFDERRAQQGTSGQAMKAMTKTAHERDRAIAELKRDQEHDRSRIRQVETETLKVKQRLAEAKARTVDLENNVNNLQRQVTGRDKALAKEAARSIDFQTRLAQAEKKIDSLHAFNRDLAEQLSKSESHELALNKDL